MKKIFLSLCFFLTAFVSVSQIIADRQKMSYNPATHILTLENSDPVDLSGLVGGSSTVTDFSLSGNTLSFTLDGGTPVTVDLSTISGSGSVKYKAADYTALSALSSPSTGDIAVVTNEGISGTFIYDAALSATDNGGTIIDGWVRKYSGALKVRWFGAIGSGTGDDYANIIKAISALKVTDVGPSTGTESASPQVLDFEDGVYNISDALPLGQYHHYKGDNAVIRKHPVDYSVSSGTAFVGDGRNSKIKGFTLQEFATAININNSNINASTVDIEDVTFINCDLAAKIEAQSSLVTFRRVKAVRTKRILDQVKGDLVVFRDSWFQPTGWELETDYHAFNLQDGLLSIHNCIGVPPERVDDEDDENAWVGMYGNSRLYIGDGSRFGGEYGGMTLVNAYDLTYTDVTYITLENIHADISDYGSNPIPEVDRIVGVRIMANFPRHLSISNLYSTPNTNLLGFGDGIDPSTVTIQTNADRSKIVPYLDLKPTSLQKQVNDADRLLLLPRVVLDRSEFSSMPNNVGYRANLTNGTSIPVLKYNTSNAVQVGGNQEIRLDGDVTIEPPSKIFLTNGQTDAANAVGVEINTDNTFATNGAKLLRVLNNGSEKANIDKDGNLSLSGTVDGRDVAADGATIDALETEKAGLANVNNWLGRQTFLNGYLNPSYGYTGQLDGVSDRRWLYGKSSGEINGDFKFERQNTSATDIAGSYITIGKINGSGTPIDPTDLTDKDYVDSEIAANAPTGLNWEAASTKTLGPLDEGKLFFNNTGTDYTYTIDTEASAGYGEDMAFTFTHEGVGVVRVVGEDGVTITPYEFETNTAHAAVSLVRRGANNWLVKGTSFDEYISANPNIFDNANPLGYASESNSIVNGINETHANLTLSAESSNVSDGTYALRITATGPGSFQVLRPAGLEVGESYNISLDISYNGASEAIQFYTATDEEVNAVSVLVDDLTGTYKTYTLTGVTCTSLADSLSGAFRIYIPVAATVDIDKAVWIKN